MASDLAQDTAAAQAARAGQVNELAQLRKDRDELVAALELALDQMDDDQRRCGYARQIEALLARVKGR